MSTLKAATWSELTMFWHLCPITDSKQKGDAETFLNPYLVYHVFLYFKGWGGKKREKKKRSISTLRGRGNWFCIASSCSDSWMNCFEYAERGVGGKGKTLGFLYSLTKWSWTGALIRLVWTETWQQTLTVHHQKEKKKNKLKEREKRGEKTRTQSVKGIRDYYPNETDVIRDSEEIAQLCQCRETMWLVRGNQNQLLRDFYFSFEKLSYETLQHVKKQVKTTDSKSPHHCVSISHIATHKAVTVFVIFSLLSWTLAAPILTSHTLSD